MELSENGPKYIQIRNWGSPKEEEREAHSYTTFTFPTLTNRQKKAFHVAVITICLRFPVESICALVLQGTIYLLNVLQK